MFRKILQRFLMATRLASWLLAAGAVFLLIPGQAGAQGPDTPQTLRSMFLPLITAASPQPPAPGAEGAVFVRTARRSNSASAAVDASGGMHLAFADYDALNAHPAAHYFYCPGQPAEACADPAQWRGVQLSDNVDEVQLALTASGQPRLLITTSRVADDGTYGSNFRLAACDVACTNPANWSINLGAATFQTDYYLFDRPQHYFALDPSARPRLIFNDEWPGVGGVYYAFCNAQCATPGSASWYKVQIGRTGPWGESERFEQPVLTFTRAGQPRVLAHVSTLDDSDGLYYLACDSACDNRANWQRVRLFDRGTGADAGWDLALDANDRPRIAFYQGDLTPGGRRLLYAACDAACLSSASWRSASTGLAPGEGLHPALELDRQGRPRIAFLAPNAQGQGYLWCNADCLNSTQWSWLVAEASETLDEDFPIPPPANCNSSAWVGGYRPALALDSRGNPRIAYDALHLYGGGCSTGSDFRAVRWLFINQPRSASLDQEISR